MGDPEESQAPASFDACLIALGIRDRRILDLVAEIEGMHAAMDTRSVIDQAKGVIMATVGCSPDTAFAILVAQSQAENRKVREIASEIAERQERT